jgi:hypothetical protein
MKQMLKSQMKHLPPEQQDKIIRMIESNPDFFRKIAEEAEKKTAAGMSQMDATMAVLREHQAELVELMGQSNK